MGEPFMVAAKPPGTWLDSVGTDLAARGSPRGGNSTCARAAEPQLGPDSCSCCGGTHQRGGCTTGATDRGVISPGPASCRRTWIGLATPAANRRAA
ncbi:MAG TPA: hypothetical protein VFM01_05780 [Nakamurella sp.]|nr:hypothetical protein [Nakamurella sp.]